MSEVEIFAIAWIPVSVGLMAGLIYVPVWLHDRAIRRRADRAAEWGVHRN